MKKPETVEEMLVGFLFVLLRIWIKKTVQNINISHRKGILLVILLRILFHALN